MTIMMRMPARSSLLVVALVVAFPILIHGFGVKEPVSKLLTTTYVSEIARFKEETQSIVGSIDDLPYSNDVFYLRYCLEEKGGEKLKESLKWRMGAGKSICEAAKIGVTKAMEGGKWNNEAVRNASPYADKMKKYITPSTTLTTTTSQGDLAYCVRAGFIDVKGLMGGLDQPLEQMTEFFLYCKEVNSLVLNERSLAADKMLYLITVNDLKGLKILGGGKEDADFRAALSETSKIANGMYSSLNGPTLLLNLPLLLNALVKLFTPLFPPEVKARLKFESGPLSDVAELMDVSHGGKARAAFLKDVDRLCYSDK
jgi:CRAL/TRIO domain